MKSLTIVTACDKPFIWGLYLLVASLRKNGVMYPIHIVETGFTQDDKTAIEKYGNITFFTSTVDRYFLRKPEAIYTAKTDYIAWVDADCIVIGDVTDLLVPKEGTMQIQFREPQDNHDIFRYKYRPLDQPGTIPSHILSIWKNDVNERNEALYTTQPSSCNIIIHQSQLPFIRRWDHQMRRVLKGANTLIYHDDIAYSMTDEAVLCALLCFLNDSPSVSGYQLDNVTSAHLMHFCGRPKPWEGWQPHHFRYFEDVVGVIDWAVGSGYSLPPLPLSLNKSFKWLYQLRVYRMNIQLTGKKWIKRLLFAVGLLKRS